MAYLNFNEAGFAAAARFDHAAPRTDQGHFSAREWLVIALAERDRLGSLRRPGRLAKVIGDVFGIRKGQPLAQPHLEGLRRLAVLAWHRGQDVPTEELSAFRQAGFSERQAAALFARVAERKRVRGRA